MKPELDKKYFKISLYIAATLVAAYIGIMLIDSVPYAFTRITSFVDLLISMLTPVFIGFILAYLLYGPTKFIEDFLRTRKHFAIKNKTVGRTIGIIISYVCVFGLIISLILGMYYMIGGQLSKNTTFSNVINSISSYFDNNKISADTLKEELTKLDLPFMDLINDKLSDIALWIQNFITSLVTFSLSSVVSIGGNIFTFLIGFVLSIYFISSAEYFMSLCDKLFFIFFRKSKVGASLKRSLHVINVTFSNYIRGQLIEALLVGILATIALIIIDVEYAFVIGIIVGVTNLIPYVGPFIGTVLAAVIALLDGNIWKCVLAIITMQIVQQIDGNVLAPKVVGNSVGLHPAFIIIAILIGGDQAGLLGMLIAVPIAASVKALVSEWFTNKYSDEYAAARSGVTVRNEPPDSNSDTESSPARSNSKRKRK